MTSMRPVEPARLTRRQSVHLAATFGTSAALAMATAACRPDAMASQPAMAGSRPATLRLHVRTGSEADTLNERLPVFMQKFPSVKVELEPFPGGEYQTKIVALMAANSLGDVLWGGNAQSQSSKWAYLGGLQALDEFVRRERFDLNQYYKAAVEGGKLDGKLFGIPFKLHPSFCVIYFNVNAIQETGQRPPDASWTWEQVIDLSRRAKKVDATGVGRWGLILPVTGQAAQYWFCWARSWGADLYSADGKKAQLEDPKFIAAIQFVHDLIFKHQVSPNGAQLSAIGGAGGGFENGAGGLMQGSSSQKSMPTRVRDKFQIANFRWPKGPSGQRGSIAISDFLHVARQSVFKGEAWELTKHLTDKETGIRLGEGTGGASGTCGGRPDVYKHERILANPLHKAWLESVEEVMPFREPWNFRGQDIEDQVLKPEMNKLWTGEQSPTPGFFKQLNGLVQQVLDQPRGT